MTNTHPKPAHHDETGLKPPVEATQRTDSDAALALIRQKLATIYGDEPDAKQELAEAVRPGSHHSTHQQYMMQLHSSGKTMAQIQTEWHQYYQGLDDIGKHEVWQEFYSQSAQSRQQPSRLEPKYQHESNGETVTHPVQTVYPDQPAPARQPQPTSQPIAHPLYQPQPQPHAIQAPDERPSDAIRQQIRERVGSRSSKLKAKHHLQSLLFGLGFGAVTLLVVLFSFFNEVVIAPFIQPSRQVSATPIIVDPDGATPSTANEVVIPKINVQIPLDFNAKSTEEKEFEAALDRGVAHYPTTALPGQKGNASFFGHSSNNIFNPGKYKFAFVMLNELVAGDSFHITYNGVAYVYQVYDKQIVAANAIEILNPVPNKTATAMLVTCDPPGTSLRRLVVWGEQVSPNPTGNTAVTASAAGSTPFEASEGLPGNGPTLWGRIVNFLTGSSD